MKLLHALYHKRSYVFYKRSAGHKIENLCDNYAFRKFGQADLANSELCQLNKRYEKFLNRIKDGHACYGFLDQDKVIAYFWVTHSEGYAPLTFGVNFKLPSDFVYIWDCRTHTAYQRQGLYRNGLLHLLAMNNTQSAIINCETNNTISIKGIESAGFSYDFGLNVSLFLKRFVLIWKKDAVCNMKLNPKIFELY